MLSQSFTGTPAMRIAYSDELELYPASKMQDISNIRITWSWRFTFMLIMRITWYHTDCSVLRALTILYWNSSYENRLQRWAGAVSCIKDAGHFQHSHNVKLTLHFYAHNENYVISYGLFRASCSHNPLLELQLWESPTAMSWSCILHQRCRTFPTFA